MKSQSSELEIISNYPTLPYITQQESKILQNAWTFKHNILLQLFHKSNKLYYFNQIIRNQFLVNDTEVVISNIL